ncbi:MAG: acyl-CoA thioesterase [SAR324 cluster bacterium]|jgi:acyl-CoA thioester hydrolase|nr:acyl-CoA thioesterase [SAR324 cluster bacterium]
MRTELKAEVEIQVPFHDVDAMHYVWHGHYYKYFEVVRTKLFQSIDYDVLQMKASGYSWPIIETSCKYVQPMLYNQLIQVSAKIQEYENRLKIIYRISDAKTDEKLATGHTTQVAVDMKNNEMCFVSPKFLLKKVEECELFL